MAEQNETESPSPRIVLEAAVKSHLQKLGLRVPNDKDLAEVAGISLAKQFLLSKDESGEIIEEVYATDLRFKLISEWTGLPEEVAYELQYVNGYGEDMDVDLLTASKRKNERNVTKK